MADPADEDESAMGLFDEPVGYYKPEKEPTTVEHRMLTGQLLKLRLVGHSPLWGHLLWNAGRTVADYLETNSGTLIKGKTVLELGAGAGLPSLISALHGAQTVVVTDYPETELIDNLRTNIAVNCSQANNVLAEGYLWGAETTCLAQHLPESEREAGFDVLILADLLFNHSEHGKLLATMQRTLKKSRSAQALVFFTPYRPWLLQKDLNFFILAKDGGFTVEKILEKTMEEAMFEEDPGDELLRRTVFGYSLRWLEQMPE